MKRPRQLVGKMPPRSMRISDEVWERSKTRASYEGFTVSHVIYTLLEGYSKGLINVPAKAEKPPRKLRSAPLGSRTVRVPDDIWEKCKIRASFDKTTISNVVYVLLDGYSRGKVNMPQVQMRYTPPKI